jgi:predicted amidophosphoribosyltransferase
MQSLIELLFPAQCAACRRLGSGLCSSCVPSAPPLVARLPSLQVRALGAYDGALRAAVLALKDGRRDVAQALAGRLAALVATDALVVPVPTSALRRRMRGFDGVVLLARLAAHAAGAQTIETLMLVAGDAQRGRLRRERLAGVGRFRCVSSCLAGAHLVLLDDVCTTGSTLEDCALALRSCGASVSEAVTVALTQRGGPGAQRVVS